MQIRAGSGSAPLRSSSKPNEETAIGMDRLSSHCVFFLQELALPKDFGCISVDSRSTLIEFIIEIELFFSWPGTTIMQCS